VVEEEERGRREYGRRGGWNGMTKLSLCIKFEIT